MTGTNETTFYIVDRIEGGVAILQADPSSAAGPAAGETTVGSQERREVPAAQLPKDTREGDCLSFSNGVFAPAPEESRARRARIRSKLDQLRAARA